MHRLHRSDFETETQRLTEGKGVHVVYDGVGKARLIKISTCFVRVVTWCCLVDRVAQYRRLI